MKNKYVLLMISLFFILPIKTVSADNNAVHTYEHVEPYASPSATPIVESLPSVSPVIEPTQMPMETPLMPPVIESSPQPSDIKPILKKVKGVNLIRYSTDKVKVVWKKHRKASYYQVYYSKQKNSGYNLAGITRKCHMLVGKLKNNTKYYFYVKACRKKKVSESDSVKSDIVNIKTKKYRRKIIFAGDSLCQGIGYGGAFSHMKSTAEKKVVAYRGLNTVTFHTKRIFNGKTGLQKLIAEKPYRAYMMLGINEVHYRPSDQMIAEYKDMVLSIKQASPDTDIILCAISPVTRAERARHPGMKHIPEFNKKLKKLAKKLNVTYYDYTDFLKDSGGYLKLSYAEGDGYHWKIPIYSKFGDIVGRYDKSLDR